MKGMERKKAPRHLRRYAEFFKTQTRCFASASWHGHCAPSPPEHHTYSEKRGPPPDRHDADLHSAHAWRAVTNIPYRAPARHSSPNGKVTVQCCPAARHCFVVGTHMHRSFVPLLARSLFSAHFFQSVSSGLDSSVDFLSTLQQWLVLQVKVVVDTGSSNLGQSFCRLLYFLSNLSCCVRLLS